MSSNLAYALPSRSPRQTQPGEPQGNPWNENPRQIEIVTSRAQRRARPRLAYALVAVGGLMVIFLTQLMLSIALSNGAYDISRLLIENRNLGRTQGALNEQLEVAGSSQNLAANAQQLGMVATSTSASSAYLDIATGTVFGETVAATGGAADPSLIANSLLANLALIGDAPTAPTETDTGTGVVADTGAATATTGTASGTSTASNSAVAGAPSTTAVEPSVPSTAGVLPSPVTH